MRGVVRLPFGSEYTVLLKNKNSVKAIANVEIDGEDVLQGQSIIVPANQSVEIKGWMQNMKETNKFKFIKKTKEISDFRGDRPDDGILRVEYTFEMPMSYYDWPTIVSINNEIDRNKRTFAPRANIWYTYYGGLTGGSASDGTQTFSCNQVNCSSSDDGITVKGQKIEQNYDYGHIGNLEPCSHVIILTLRGERRLNGKRKAVTKTITTRSKIQCPICGRKWKSNMNHCGNCGNYLH